MCEFVQKTSLAVVEYWMGLFLSNYVCIYQHDLHEIKLLVQESNEVRGKRKKWKRKKNGWKSIESDVVYRVSFLQVNRFSRNGFHFGPFILSCLSSTWSINYFLTRKRNRQKTAPFKKETFNRAIDFVLSTSLSSGKRTFHSFSPSPFLPTVLFSPSR